MEEDKTESVCQEADRLVSTDRQDVYGHPLDDFSKVVEAAKALQINPLAGPDHHALYLILVKLSRLSNTPGHHDSIVDICGYAKTYDLVFQEVVRRRVQAAGKEMGNVPLDVNWYTCYDEDMNGDADREGWQ